MFFLLNSISCLQHCEEISDGSDWITTEYQNNLLQQNTFFFFLTNLPQRPTETFYKKPHFKNAMQ